MLGVWNIYTLCVCVCVCVCTRVLCAYLLSHVLLFVTPWIVPCQAPLSMRILQARILECVAMPSSRGSSHPRLLLLLLSRFSCVQLCATPYTAAHQAPLSLGFSRQEHWSGLPFPSPMHENEKWKWSCPVVPNSLRPHVLQPTRFLHPWDSPGKSTGVGCHCRLLPSQRLNV